MNNIKNRPVDFLAASFLIIFSILLGLNQVMVKLVNEGMHPVFQVALRSSLAIFPILIYCYILKKKIIINNGSLVPGLIAGFLDYNFVTNCVSLNIENGKAKCSREISGGIEMSECDLPLVIGAQKGLVEESDLIIPNMRGIMMARQKPLEVLSSKNIKARAVDKKYFKPQEKAEVKLVKPDELDKLIDFLENEAKVI